MSERYSRHDDPCADHYDTPDSTEAYEPRYYQGTDLRAVALEVSAALRALDLPNMRFYGTDAEDIAGVLRLSEHFDYENPGFGSLEPVGEYDGREVTVLPCSSYATSEVLRPILDNSTLHAHATDPHCIRGNAEVLHRFVVSEPDGLDYAWALVAIPDPTGGN
jgi:hypothetical protein